MCPWTLCYHIHSHISFFILITDQPERSGFWTTKLRHQSKSKSKMCRMIDHAKLNIRPHLIKISECIKIKRERESEKRKKSLWIPWGSYQRCILCLSPNFQVVCRRSWIVSRAVDHILKPLNAIWSFDKRYSEVTRNFNWFI